jgi:hypothetical protein
VSLNRFVWGDPRSGATTTRRNRFRKTIVVW